MTPEAIRETLFRTLDKLDELYGDRSTAEEMLRREREAHAQEVVNLRSELSSKDRILAEKDRCLTEKERSLAEKDNRIVSLEKALAESEAARTDADHKVSSMNQERHSRVGRSAGYKLQKRREGGDDKP